MRSLARAATGFLVTTALLSGPIAFAEDPRRGPRIGSSARGGSSRAKPGADGKPRVADYTGLLVFARDRHMSVQVTYRPPEAETQAAPGVQCVQGRYEASFGRYEIDDRAHTFPYHVDGALVRALVGKDLPRGYEKPSSPSQLRVRLGAMT